MHYMFGLGVLKFRMLYGSGHWQAGRMNTDCLQRARHDVCIPRVEGGLDGRLLNGTAKIRSRLDNLLHCPKRNTILKRPHDYTLTFPSASKHIRLSLSSWPFIRLSKHDMHVCIYPPLYS